MPTTTLPIVLALVGSLASAAAAQESRHKPDAAPANPPAPSTPAPAPAAKPAFPPTPNKQLYATNDFRNRKGPEISAESWLTPAAKPAAPDTKGKVVLVDFWGTWCRPCRDLIPELNRWHKEFKNDLVVIGISDEPAPKVEAFMKNTTIDYHMAVDTRRNEAMRSRIGIEGVPHVLVYDSTGVVRWQGFPTSPDDTLTTDKLRQIIEADKAQRPAPKPADAAPDQPATPAPAAPAPSKPRPASPGPKR